MIKVEDVIQIFNKGQNLVNLECTAYDHDRLVTSLLPAMKDHRTVILAKDEGIYDFMTLKAYLVLFADVVGSDVDVHEVLELLKLERYFLERIDSLDTSIQKRVLLARALIVDPSFIIFEEPLKDVNREAAQILVSAIETIGERGISVLCTSDSFRTVSLLEGNSYHIRGDVLVPIYESIDLGMTLTDQNTSQTPILEIRSEGKTLLINIDEILFAESIESVCHVFVKNSYVATSFTLEELETKLKDYRFFRSHRSYLVNVAAVEEIQQWTRNSYVLSLKGLENMEIPLSKRRYADFKDLLHSA